MPLGILAMDATQALDLAQLVPFGPLTSLAIIFLLLLFVPKGVRESGPFAQLCGWISVAGIATTGLLATMIWMAFFRGDFAAEMTLAGGGGLAREYTWSMLGSWPMKVGIILDPLAITTLFMVGWVATMIQVFSIGYMHGEAHFPRYFAYHSLFVTGMLILVISDNFLTLLVGWELMGLCSYLLIGFYTKKASANAAQLKAFLTTRLADMFMLLGIAMVMGFVIQANATGMRPPGKEITARVMAGEISSQYATWQDVSKTSFQFATIQQTIAQTLAADPAQVSESGRPNPQLKYYGALMIAAFLVFVGTMGKSAQFPLHIWLPDAMEGPTPVSALIHAATMVAAGVYLIARTYFLFDPLNVGVSPALLALAVIGGFTALWAATIGLAQYDIKRVLAYSTLSQLGYMVAGLGVGAYAAGAFHLVTHAYFKALLFLGSGAVILACHHNQDMRYMGRLSKYLKWSFYAYMIGYLALIGTPGLAGAFSKDAIIVGAFDRLHGEGGVLYPFVFWCLILGAFLTPLYMTRQMAMIFYGPKYRGDENPDAHGHGHDAAAHGHDDAHGHHEVAHAEDHAHAAVHDGHGAHDAHDGHHGGEPHEQPVIIWGPLMVLSLFTVLIGWFYAPHGPFLTKLSVPSLDHHAFGGVPTVFASAYYPKSWMGGHHDDGHGDEHGAGHGDEHHESEYYPGLVKYAGHEPVVASHDTHLIVEWAIFLMALLGVGVGYLIYGKDAPIVFGMRKDAFKATPQGAALFRLLNNKYYIDEIYAAYIITPFLVFTHWCRAFDTFIMDGIVNGVGLLWLGLTRIARWLDQRVVDGFVNLLAWVTQSSSKGIRFIQSGFIQNYFMVVVVSVLIWLFYAHSMKITTASNEGQVHPAQAMDAALQQGGLTPPR
ncbi:MAG: NAD(P)H-quinone oxidoreductase subunit 2, chloroplastic [bacterium]|nr:NAD(P)H-quinone oxidoreductase subunit 2, chloroplastic [bacterium]